MFLTLAFVMPSILPAQPLSSTSWATSSTVDDFTDSADKVIAAVKSEDGESAFSILCQSQEQFLSANIRFQAYLGIAAKSQVRWRIGKEEARTEEWTLDRQVATDLLYAPAFDKMFREDALIRSALEEMVQQHLVNGILSAPRNANAMIYEVTDSDGDKHRGKVTLRGSKDAVREVLASCPNWNYPSLQ